MPLTILGVALRRPNERITIGGMFDGIAGQT